MNFLSKTAEKSFCDFHDLKSKYRNYVTGRSLSTSKVVL